MGAELSPFFSPRTKIAQRVNAMIPSFRLDGWSIRSRLVVTLVGVMALLLLLGREPVRRIETAAMSRSFGISTQALSTLWCPHFRTT